MKLFRNTFYRGFLWTVILTNSIEFFLTNYNMGWIYSIVIFSILIGLDEYYELNHDVSTRKAE